MGISYALKRDSQNIHVQGRASTQTWGGGQIRALISPPQALMSPPEALMSPILSKGDTAASGGPPLSKGPRQPWVQVRGYKGIQQPAAAPLSVRGPANPGYR